MKRLAALPRLIFKPKKFTTIVMMLIIWAGVASALFAGITTDLRNRDYLKGRAQIIANALPTQQIKDLHGDQRDLTSLSYVQIKDRLQEIKAGNHDLRFVYLMGQKNHKVFFYVDSENTNSEGYSGPGDPYDEASPRLLSVFNSTQPTIEGPSRDHWGTWISAMAPIVDPKTQQVLGVVGIDTPAINYYAQVLLYAMVPLLLAAIPLAGLIRDMKLQSKEFEILKLKEQFVSIASHELRSPLAGMLWAIQSLSKSSADKLSLAQLTLLTDMYRSTESSLGTVNEILDMSIFERQQGDKLQHEKLDLVAVIRQVVATLKLGAQEKNLHIEPAGLWPRQVYTEGDVAALKRALMNILSNAIKYSRESTTIHITYQGANHEHIIGIKDQGIGIPEEEKAKVLDGYYRATNATAVQAHGTGLGLWVTKKIIEQHGGRLWLDSVLNEGTTIYVSLPVVEPPTPKITTSSGGAAQTALSATSPVPSQSAVAASQDPGLPSTDTPSRLT